MTADEESDARSALDRQRKEIERIFKYCGKEFTPPHGWSDVDRLLSLYNNHYDGLTSLKGMGRRQIAAFCALQEALDRKIPSNNVPFDRDAVIRLIGPKK